MAKKEFLEKFIIVILIGIVLLFYGIQYYNTNFVVIALIVIEIYTLIKCRKNPILFFVFLCMLYFDYSVVISKYIMSTPNFEEIFHTIKYENTLYIGIASVFIFHAVILLFIREKNKNVLQQKYIMNPTDVNNQNSNNTVLIILTFCITIILFDYLFWGFLSLSRSIYEYSLILFIIAFYYARNNNFFKKVLFILMMISTVVNTLKGGRIVSLQPMVAYFFIYYMDKLNSKRISVVVLLGIVIFNILGLYGDYLDSNIGIGYLNFEMIADTFTIRKFALDTSISAYWTGITFIEISNIVPISERVKNFIEYMTIYTIGGNGTSYVHVFELSRTYYLHYYGGYITSYFYYWASWIGVIGIGAFIGSIIKRIYNAKSNIGEFQKIFIIYFASSVPRWYLYYPTTLIRGAIILYIVYIILKLVTQKSNKKRRRELE